MNPNQHPQTGQMTPALQQVLQQGIQPAPSGQPQGTPQGQPMSPQSITSPVSPQGGLGQMAPTPQMPFDPAEIKMIEGALINRLKALTDAQFPEPPKPSIQGGTQS